MTVAGVSSRPLPSRALLAASAAAALLSAASCAGLQVHVADSSIRKPGHLALFVSIDDNEGEPIGGLKADRFRLSEDGKPISTQEAKLQIWNPTLPAANYTMVLVDTSGSVSGSGQVSSVVQAARDFALRISGPIHRVAVYRFDGAEHIQKLSEFGSSPSGAFFNPMSFTPRDISTNLNGAVVESIEALTTRRELGMTPLQFGTLVIFTDGSERAHRVSRGAALAAIRNTDIDVFVVAVPGEIDTDELRPLAKNGLFTFPGDVGQLNATFDTMRRRIEARTHGYYLISYCSPARAGEHELSIDVDAGQRQGVARFKFGADEFVPGCEPTYTPTFDWQVRYRRRAGEDAKHR